MYHQYKWGGAAPLALPRDDPFRWEDVDGETGEFLSEVWNTFGGYSAGRLRNMTHNEPPGGTAGATANGASSSARAHLRTTSGSS